MKVLLYHQHLQRTEEIIEGRLLLIDTEVAAIANTYIAASGLPNYQRFDCLSTPGRGSIPPNSLVGVNSYSVSTTPLYMPDIKGVEGNFYKINPDTVTVNGVQRGDFGIHFDANVPGSSGCLVIRTAVGWQAFEKNMKALLTSGVNKIQLLVSYSR